MFEEEVFKRLINGLNRHNIPYMLTGGLAVTIWGRVRSTLDIDIVIDVKEKDIEQLLQAFQKNFYIDAEAVKFALNKNLSFNVIDVKTNTTIDCYLLGDSEYDRAQFQRKIIKNIVGVKVAVVSPEDLILSKLEWYQKGGSTRQLEDIESVLRISGNKLDMNYLEKWVKKIGNSNIWNKLKNKINRI